MPKKKDTDSKKDPEKNGKSEDGKSGAGQGGDENIKALQRKLSEKDTEIKNLEKQLEDSKTSSEKEISKLTDSVSKLTEYVDEIKGEKRTEELSEKYPDISPSLLSSIPDDKLDDVVEEQRKINEEKFGDSRYFEQPKYSSVDEIDEKIKEVNETKEMSGEDKGVAIMKLEREKTNFDNN